MFGACHRTTAIVGAGRADPMAAALQCQKLCCMCKQCGTFFSKKHPRSKHLKGKCGGIPERAGRVECSKCGLSIAEKVWRHHSNSACKRRLQHLQKVSRTDIYMRYGRHETDGQNIHNRCASGWRAWLLPPSSPPSSIMILFLEPHIYDTRGYSHICCVLQGNQHFLILLGHTYE